jgi:hypothetical protein
MMQTDFNDMDKQCTRCKEVKELSMFGAYKHKAHGYETRCKKCISDLKVEYRRRKGIHTQYYQKKSEDRSASVDYEAHKKRVRERAYALYWQEPEKARLAKRTKHGRMVKWATEFDEFVVREAHKLAQQRESVLGMKWHVDHIIPLQGRNVSGLHCCQNLQVIPQTINNQKKNMFDEQFLNMSKSDWLTWTP